MAQLNFPDPNTTQTYTEAGITWTWNATLGVWSAEPGSADDALTEIQADSLYLSKKNDDTAAGEITFEKKTTHVGGLRMSGGEGVFEGNIIANYYEGNDPSIQLRRENDAGTDWEMAFIVESSGRVEGTFKNSGQTGRSVRGISMSPEIDFSTSGNGNDNSSIASSYLSEPIFKLEGSSAANFAAFTAWAPQIINGQGGDVDNYYCFNADFSNGNRSFSKAVGFRSNLREDGDKNYNFYASGDAPNYFAGLTEHVSGLKVMGGNKTTIPLGISSDGNGFVALNAEGNEVLLATSYQCTRNIDQHSGLSGPSWYGYDVRGVPTLASTAAVNVRFLPSSTQVQDVIGLHVQGDYTGNVTKKVAGVLSGVTDSAVTSGGGHSFNFLAEGNAPNHFAGAVRFYPYSDDAYNPSGPINRSLDGVVIDHRDSIHIHACKSTNDDAPAMRINRSGTSSNRRLMDFTAGSGSTVGGITTDGATITIFNMTSDYRIKTNIQELTNATQKIQALNPVSFEYTDRNPGVSYQGFVAHELAEVCPKAVVGTKDATEVIGTLTDVDGNVETEVTEPEAIPFGATWEQTGTRDVLQGVDQTKLIPLLTKALQEALDKIETLETRLSDAGIA